MASILNNIPTDSALTKLVYERPRIALYANNSEFIMKDTQITSNMANILKKRILIRTDESIRLPEKESSKMLLEVLPAENGIGEILFDDALGETKVWIRSLATSIDFNSINNEFLKKTGWKLVLMRSPEMITSIKEINDVLKK